jgi:hypothetical protein
MKSGKLFADLEEISNPATMDFSSLLAELVAQLRLPTCKAMDENCS